MLVYFISVIWQLQYMGYGYLLLEAMPFRVSLLLKDNKVRSSWIAIAAWLPCLLLTQCLSCRFDSYCFNEDLFLVFLIVLPDS